MTSPACLLIDFRDYWHCGTGLGHGHLLDAVCVRDRLGLPLVPGRTVKGLMRHAVAASAGLGACDPGLVEVLFGTDGFEAGVARSQTTPGCLRFSSAVLPAGVRDELAQLAPAERAARTAPLFSMLRMTAIDQRSGAARDRTLRSIEVAVPLRLQATIEAIGPVPPDWRGVIAGAAPLIRAVGAHRTRGLGRASCRIAGGGS